ncbi:dienelactone hydrolase family protein [Kiritimatiellota bacterium B12222]|nr:dienelactone hydrolase family protein [Kiritimatiellota bacterium B12222]
MPKHIPTPGFLMIRTFFTLSLISFFPYFLIHADSHVVDYDVNGQTYEGYYSAETPNAPLVLLLHDWDGLTGYEVIRSDMLAAQGYAVFAADLFGKGIRPTENKDKRQHTGELYQDREKLRSLLQGALDAAKAQGADTEHVVVIGYCFGGAAALEVARAGMPVKGVVTFHGGLGTPEGQNYEQTEAKLLIFHGSADSHISLDDFTQLGKELEAAKVSHEMITYGGAPHSFTLLDTDAYTKEADNHSWTRLLTFLTETLTPAENSN